MWENRFSVAPKVSEPRGPASREAKYRCLFSVQLDHAGEAKEMNVPGVDYRVLRAEISMEQALNQLNFQPTARSGDQWHGSRPVHGSVSPGSRSFSVNLATGRYYWHKCQSHGNALELWAAVHHLRIYDAALDLCRALARNVPWIKRW
jgi:hypothetical protein